MYQSMWVHPIIIIFLTWHKINVIISKNNSGVRFTEDGRIDFIQSILKWQRGYDIINDQRCLAINFGYKKAMPFPTIELYPTHDFYLNVGTLGANSPNKCSIVVIGGKYLEQVDKVMRMVNKITEDIAWMPSAVFLMAEKPGQDIKFNVSARDNMSPTMYRVPATRSSLVQFVMTCPGMSHSSTFTLHMRDSGKVDDGKVWGDLCREKRVNIAHPNKPNNFYVDENGKMIKYPILTRAKSTHTAWDYEILESFFKNHDIVPSWTNCHYNWGTYDASLKQWTGAIGKVSENTRQVKCYLAVLCYR